MSLLSEWGQWTPDGPPFTFQGDREALEAATKHPMPVTTIGSWSAAYSAEDFAKPKDTRLHLGLLPQPFIGDLKRASIYVLSLNPGLDPTDYYGEYEVESYRSALLNTLKQKFPNGSSPFLFLDPQYSWHGGFRWWNDKLSGVIERLAVVRKISTAAARAILATEIASLELLPYHSKQFDAHRWLGKLTSVELARDFVQSDVLPRVLDGKATVIVTRQGERWKLPPDIERIVCYHGWESQGAHLTPKSRGGQAILKQLGVSAT